MIRTVIAAAVFVISGLPSEAQDVPIRSGEHRGFTRLALDMPQRIAWTRERQDTGLSIIFADRTLSFDIGQVYTRATRDRLADLSAPSEGGRLDLRLACDCRVDLFWHARAMLVIDIHDGPPAEDSQAADTGQHAAASAAMPLQPLSTAAAMALDAMPVAPHRPDGSADHEDVPPAGLPRPMPGAIVREMARAASFGVLDRSTPAPAGLDPSEPPGPNLTRDAPTQDPETSDPIANISVRTRPLADLAAEGQPSEAMVSPGLAECLPNQAVDVPGWAGDAPFHSQVGALNRELVQEFDKTDRGRLLDLARLYIHFGFGAEARQVASLLDDSAPAAEVLLEMAEVVDRLQAPADGVLSMDLECHGPSALWAVLALRTLPKDRPLDHKEILKAFRALPEHLRRHFGPVLSRRLGAAGHVRTADMVLRTSGYPQPSMSSARGLATAELAFVEGDTQRAEMALQSAMEENTQSAAEAALALIERRLDEGRHVPYDTARLAGAFHQQYRGTAMEPRLAAAYLPALAASGHFADAFREHDRLSSGMPAGVSDAAWHAILERLERDATDVTFLRHILNDKGRAVKPLPDALAFDIAERLLDLGFADQALARMPSAETTRSKLLHGRLALARGNPREAHDAVQGVTGAEADGLRARASSMLGDHAAAARLYRSAEEGAAADRAAWLARDWPQVGQADDGLLQRLARTITEQAPLGAGDLTQKRDLLEKSAKLRSVLEEVITRQGL